MSNEKYRSHLERVLREGHFAVTGEIGPPKSADGDVVRKKAQILRGFVDAANITDCQTAIVRMSSIASGVLVQQEGVEAVIQMTCRDRNRIAIQADLLGAAALGMKNLLCLTGDHQKFGNHPEAKGVFDLDSIQLLDMVRRMRDERKFQCGEEIKGKTVEFFIGAAENPFADPFEFRVQRLAKKVAAGAQFIQTQIVYNLERFKKFMEMAHDMGLTEKVYILAGITPPKSFGMARYMKYFVPGLDVPDEILKRMKGAKDKREEGINIAVEIIEQVREIPGIAGVHIMAIEWEEAVPEIVKRAGLHPRPLAEEVKPVEVARPAPEVVLPKEEVPAEEEVPEAPPKVEVPAEALKQIFGSLRSSMEALRDGINLLHEGLASLERTLLGGAPPEMKEAVAPEAPPVEEKPAEAPSVTPEEEARAQKVADLLSAAKAAREAGELSKAQALYKQVLELEAENEIAKAALAGIEKELLVEDLLRKAQQKLEAGDLDGAEAAFKKVLEIFPQKTEAEKGLEKIAELRAAREKEKEAKPAAPPKEEKPAAAPEVADILVFPDVALEYRDVSERAAGIPEDVYKEPGTAYIREVTIGEGEKAITIGGTNVLPFHLFEGEMKNPPHVAMEVLDVKPEDWPEALAKYFEDVFSDPGDWAKKCVEVYGAEAINVYLLGTDPNFLNLGPDHAAKVVEKVAKAVDVPLVIWGSGSPEKDVDVLREVANVLGAKNVMIGPVVDTNHRALGATAMGYGYSLIASSPIDVNLAKQLNILLENVGVPLDKIAMDPSVGALGYGLEYTYSVMERIRLAALYAQDEKLQVPFVINVGREVWKTKEAGLPSDDLIGDQEVRGIALEAITAIALLMAGGDFLIMRHPKAIEVTQKVIKGLMAQ